MHPAHPDRFGFTAHNKNCTFTARSNFDYLATSPGHTQVRLTPLLNSTCERGLTFTSRRQIGPQKYRRRSNAGLNKGEARNALARAVFFYRLGEIRDRTFENQRYRASGPISPSRL